MRFTLTEQSYPGRSIYPRPEIHFDEETGFAVIAFPWGARASARKAIDYVIDFFFSTQSDQEVTSPFDKLSVLSPMANNLRVALMLTNDLIYKEENKDELVAGLEILILASNQGELVMGQVGAPASYLLINQSTSRLVPLQAAQGLSASVADRFDAPLPQSLLGTQSTSVVRMNAFRPQPGDRMILTTLDSLPLGFPGWIRKSYRFQQILDDMVQQDPERGFWLGQITF